MGGCGRRNFWVPATNGEAQDHGPALLNRKCTAGHPRATESRGGWPPCECVMCLSHSLVLFLPKIEHSGLAAAWVWLLQGEMSGP